MKRSFVIILALMLTLSGCTFYTQVYTNETEPENEEYRIVTETKQVIQEISITYEDGRTEQVIYNYEQYKDSLPPYSAEFYENGQLIRVEQYTWDEQENLISIVPEGKENEVQTFELTYDEQGLVTEKLCFNAQTETGKETYSYDDAGRLTQTNVYKDEILVSSTATEYDENGRCRTVTVFDGQGNVITRREHSFDEKKYAETVLEYDGSGALVHRYVNGYNIGNVVVSQEVYDAQDNLLYTTYWRYSTSSYSYLEPAA